mmetsp:Transcript_58900/g.120532  ORF Transcript_58900/g.120532 Transcript_58900/m.120532 type:complete len:86 (+) Transcript_58900:1491-1748(+)
MRRRLRSTSAWGGSDQRGTSSLLLLLQGISVKVVVSAHTHRSQATPQHEEPVPVQRMSLASVSRNVLACLRVCAEVPCGIEHPFE